jgi:uncharacterized protein YjbJ (UPF0337 family)
VGLSDKISNKAEKVTGAAKEKLGELRDDDEQKTEGQVDQGKADLKNAGENVKDAAGDAKDAFKH